MVRAARLLSRSGLAALVFAAAVLLPLGEEGALVLALLGSFVLPALSAAVCAVVTGRRLARDPGRSRVPAAASAGSLALSAGWTCASWTTFEPTGAYPLDSRGALLVETLVLGGIALGATVALVGILRSSPARPVAGWVTGAAWVTVGLVALLSGQVAALSVPRVSSVVPAAAEREQEQDCREAEGLRSAVLPAGVPRAPSFPGSTPGGSRLLPPARTGDRVGTGLDRYARVGAPVVVSVATTRTDDVEDASRSIDRGLAQAGLRRSSTSSATTNGRLQVYAVTFTGAQREGVVEAQPCGDGTLLVTSEVVPAGRTGACSAQALQARCDALLRVTQAVRDRFDGGPVTVVDGRLQLVLVREEAFPAGFVTGDVLEAFSADGWRLLTSSCGDFCFAADTPVALDLSRPGYRGAARLTAGREALGTRVRVTVRESTR